jgi:hypothetical protein
LSCGGRGRKRKAEQGEKEQKRNLGSLGSLLCRLFLFLFHCLLELLLRILRERLNSRQRQREWSTVVAEIPASEEMQEINVEKDGKVRMLFV